MSHILIVEDNEDLSMGLRQNLEIEGYQVSTAATGSAGVREFQALNPDLMILDLMLPEMDGFAVLDSIRQSDTTTPVLILTARGEELDKVRGLRQGADDYVTKPFGLMELLARVEALLRRGGGASLNATRDSIRIGRLLIDPDLRRITKDDQEVELAPKEFDLLLELIRHQGAVVTRIDLMKEVWGHASVVVSRTVDTHIAELRRKLEDDASNPCLIITVRKSGYRVVMDGPSCL